MPNTAIDKKGPAVKIPPPLIFIGFLMLGFGLHHLFPVGFGPAHWGPFIGSLLIIISLLTLVTLLISYIRAKTHIEPWKPTSHLITTGLYRWSRNPIYAAFCLLNIGIGCYVNSLWVVLSFLPSAWAVYHIAIQKEENYLSQKFGAEYLAYKEKVRRWL